MAKKESTKSQKRVRSLRAKPLSGENARRVKGGITVSKVTDVSSSLLFREAVGNTKVQKV